MQLIAADIIAEAHGLSVPFAAAGVAIGALLWILGWRWHRFWVVLATTVAAGLAGLSTQQAIGPRMLAGGVVLVVTSPSAKEPEPAKAWITPLLGPGAAGLSLGRTW